MDNTHDPQTAGIDTAFVALAFSVFAVAARFLDDPRLSTGKADEGGMGMLYYERCAESIHFRLRKTRLRMFRL